MTLQPRKMVFMGSDAIALPALEEIHERWRDRIELIACYTQPDRRTGRGKKLQANAIKVWALEKGIEVRQPDRLGEDDIAFLREAGCAVVLVMAYGHILRKRFLETPPLGTFNLHASILPKYRGAAPLNAAIAEGDSETGVSLMRMVRKLDAGPVADIEKFPLARLETAATVTEKAAEVCVPLLRRNLGAIIEGCLEVAEQDAGGVSFTRKLEKADGTLDFSQPAWMLARRVNALFPWPSVQVEIGGERVRFGLGDFEEIAVEGLAGEVLEADESLKVRTGEGILNVLRLQRPGGRMLEAKDFLRGFRVEPGTLLPSAPMPKLVSTEPFAIKQA